MLLVSDLDQGISERPVWAGREVAKESARWCFAQAMPYCYALGALGFRSSRKRGKRALQSFVGRARAHVHSICSGGIAWQAAKEKSGLLCHTLTHCKKELHKNSETWREVSRGGPLQHCTLLYAVLHSFLSTTDIECVALFNRRSCIGVVKNHSPSLSLPPCLRQRDWKCKKPSSF